MHVGDAARLSALVRAQLDRCGPFAHHLTINAVRVVSAVCEAGRCAAHETVLHIDEPE